MEPGCPVRFFTDPLRKNEPYSHKENTARLSSLVIFAVSAVIFGVVLALVLLIIHIVVLRHEKYLLKCLFSNYTHSMVRFI